METTEALIDLTAGTDIGEAVDMAVDELKNIDEAIVAALKDTFNSLIVQAIVFATGLVKALIILLFGYIIMRIILWAVGKAMRAAGCDDLVTNFVLSSVKGLLWLVIIAAVMDSLGIDSTIITTIFTALGVGFAWAVSDFAGNFVSGLKIIQSKPFVCDDLIEISGYLGIVNEISVFSTRLLTLDNRVTVVPNKQFAGAILINYTKEDLRMVDMRCGVAYDADIDQTRKILLKICKSCPYAASGHEPTVAVHELGDSAVNFVVRIWTAKATYWDTYWSTHEAMKKKLDIAGIGIPFPQRDCHLFIDDLDALQLQTKSKKK